MNEEKTTMNEQMEKLSVKITDWMGTPQAVAVHTMLFLLTFVLIWMGANADTVMLGLTTAVSLEAIYLALFIQMTVNRHSKSLSEVEKDINEIQEDVEDVSEDIQEDDQIDVTTATTLKKIEEQMFLLSEEIKELRRKV